MSSYYGSICWKDFGSQWVTLKHLCWKPVDYVYVEWFVNSSLIYVYFVIEQSLSTNDSRWHFCSASKPDWHILFSKIFNRKSGLKEEIVFLHMWNKICCKIMPSWIHRVILRVAWSIRYCLTCTWAHLENKWHFYIGNEKVWYRLTVKHWPNSESGIPTLESVLEKMYSASTDVWVPSVCPHSHWWAFSSKQGKDVRFVNSCSSSALTFEPGFIPSSK